ncbi:MAG: hypothetical protein ACI4XL_11130 [Bacillus sp. (in: firmicutes)]
MFHPEMPDAFIGYETLWDRFSYPLYVWGLTSAEHDEDIGIFLSLIEPADFEQATFDEFRQQYCVCMASLRHNDLPRQWFL